jgi:LysR family transcriptional regulator for metE and metH
MSDDLEFKDLALVRAIATAGGVSRAARSLHVSQSAVSHHLSRLEDRLGVALFDRTGRGLTIAPAGTRLVALANEILPKVRAVQQQLRPSTARTLRLATQCYTTYHWLPGLTAQLAAHHPHVQLRIVLEATRDPMGALRAGKLDLALVHTLGDHPGFVARLVSRDHLVLVMAPDHPLAARKRLRPTDLHPYTFFVFDSTSAELREQGALTFPNGDAPPTIHRVPLTEALVQLVRSGQGVSLLSAWTARPYLERGELVSRPLQTAVVERTWRAVYERDGELTEPVRTLVDHLVDREALR